MTMKYAFIFYRKYFIVCIPLLGTQAIQQVQAQEKDYIDTREMLFIGCCFEKRNQRRDNIY